MGMSQTGYEFTMRLDEMVFILWYSPGVMSNAKTQSWTPCELAMGWGVLLDEHESITMQSIRHEDTLRTGAAFSRFILSLYFQSTGHNAWEAVLCVAKP